MSRARRPARLRELTALFTDLRRAHPEAETFAGGSWLYYLPTCQALFPPEYIASMTPTRSGLTYLDVWGQFLDRRWQLRPAPCREFIANIHHAASRDDLETSFPFPPMLARAPIWHFYTFYHIG